MNSADEAAEGAASRTLLEILRKTTDYLRARGCDAPRLEAELLLARGLDIKRLDIYLQFDRPLLDSELATCRELVLRRGAREPMAYVLGEREFHSLAFEVDNHVLVPRPETETLVEETLRFLHGASLVNPSIADIGTGSGCIAVSLAHARKDLTAIATDDSLAALRVACRNAHRHGVAGRIRLVNTRFLEGVNPTPPFDAVVSNPPYILPEEKGSLPRELDYEPRDALFAPGGDVKSVFASIARHAKRTARRGAALLIEIGEKQGALATATLLYEGVERVSVVKDLTGSDRIVVGTIP